MSKIRIFPALLIFTLLTLQIHTALGADKGQKLLLKKSFSTEQGDGLKVNGCAGNVKITPWFKNEIEVKIYGRSEAGKFLDFKVSNDEQGINICVLKKMGIEKVNNHCLRYEVKVPRDYFVRVLKCAGNIVVNDRNGSMKISTPPGGNVLTVP